MTLLMDGWNPTFYSQFQQNAAIAPYSPGYDPRVFRGGNWNSSSAECRSAFRLALGASLHPNYVVFRVVLSVEEAR